MWTVSVIEGFEIQGGVRVRLAMFVENGVGVVVEVILMLGAALWGCLLVIDRTWRLWWPYAVG